MLQPWESPAGLPVVFFSSSRYVDGASTIILLVLIAAFKGFCFS